MMARPVLLGSAMVKKTVRQSAITPEVFFPSLSDIERDVAEILRKNQGSQAGKRPDFALTWFEIDRSSMAGQLRNLRRAIEESATEMEMVAAERVFSKSLSRALTRRARTLQRAANDLNHLLRLVARAQIPKATRLKPGRQS